MYSRPRSSMLRRSSSSTSSSIVLRLDRKTIELEVEEELRLHIELLGREYIQQGMSSSGFSSSLSPGGIVRRCLLRLRRGAQAHLCVRANLRRQEHGEECFKRMSRMLIAVTGDDGKPA